MPAEHIPPSRFVRATYLNQFSPTPKGNADGTQLMARLSNHVDISLGVAKSFHGNETTMNHTQLVAIKDVTQNRFQIENCAYRTKFIQIHSDRIFQANKSMNGPLNALP